jgi:hypothetical protein
MGTCDFSQDGGSEGEMVYMVAEGKEKIHAYVVLDLFDNKVY